MTTCDFCSEALGEKHVGSLNTSSGVKHFHVGMFKDCRNEYLKGGDRAKNALHLGNGYSNPSRYVRVYEAGEEEHYAYG